MQRSALADQETTPVIRLAGVAKHYGNAVALHDIDLDIASGEFFTFLGPSGSGKTTTLRLIAGFEAPDKGRIELDGRDVAKLPPHARDVNTVFQDYALFPHLNLAENVAYGLRAKKVAAPEAARRADEALAMVQLEALARRRPAQLSGGQRQRVALARALVNRPRVLLLDEPLGALDLKLRHQMQVELKALQRRTGITFLYVTHDQEEALTMSDRVAVFSQGRIAQIGTPEDLYEHPATAFVAGFVGISNFLTRGGARHALRPEKIQILPPDAAPPPGTETAPARIESAAYLGMFTRYTLTLEHAEPLIAIQQNGTARRWAEGDAVLAAWPSTALKPLHKGDQE